MPKKKISEETPQDAVGILEKETAEATEAESEITALEMADVATEESSEVLDEKSGMDPAPISQAEGVEYGEPPPPAPLPEEEAEILTVSLEDGAAPDTPDASEATEHDLYEAADPVPEDQDGIIQPEPLPKEFTQTKRFLKGRQERRSILKLQSFLRI